MLLVFLSADQCEFVTSNIEKLVGHGWVIIWVTVYVYVIVYPWPTCDAGGCFTNVSRALQNILSKFVYCKNSTCDENFKLKLCTCAQSLALGTRTKFQIDIFTTNVISGVVYFRGILFSMDDSGVFTSIPTLFILHQFHINFVLWIMDHFVTHWGRNEMSAILQTAFWNAFSWIKRMNFD